MASPGLVFAQMSARLALPELAAVTMELCGRYGRVRWLERGFLDRSPVATIGSLRAYLAQLDAHPNIGKANHALDLALVGSRSPLETSFSLMVSLPEALGGCGFERPEPNRRIDPSPELRSYCSQGWYEADLCWPDQHVICEVNSRQNHLTPEAQDHDAAKAGALRALGWEVCSVTVGLLKRAQTREALFSQIALLLGAGNLSHEAEAVRLRARLAKRLLAW